MQPYAVFAVLQIWKDIEGYGDCSLDPLSEDYIWVIVGQAINFKARSAFSHGFCAIERVVYP